MDDGISFGEIESSQPEEAIRPDQNSHFAVANVGAPAAEQLPVYIDLDTTLDIEEHALEDTSIELGGILLGGQYVDDQGQPFVVVRDSLRAEHYEATKGSFKFTHETWEAIGRQKEKFPEGTEIVGWYHTHPDWGVFLSGMDMFICNGFFNRPLDVALVVDPVRQDRGWFHWATVEGNAVKERNHGYFLFASRFRGDQLQQTAEALIYQEGSSLVTRQQISQASAATPIINITQPDNKGQSIVMLAMLGMQTLLVAALILYVVNGESPGSPDQDAYKNVIAAMIVNQEGGVDEAKVQSRVQQLVDRQAQVEQLKTEVSSLVLGAKAFEKRSQVLAESLNKKTTANNELKTQNTKMLTELELLRNENAANAAIVAKAQSEGLLQWWESWTNIAIAAAIVIGAAIAGAVVTLYVRGDREMIDSDDVVRVEDGR